MARESQRIDAESLANSFQTADFTQNTAYDPLGIAAIKKEAIGNRSNKDTKRPCGRWESRRLEIAATKTQNVPADVGNRGNMQ